MSHTKRLYCQLMNNSFNALLSKVLIWFAAGMSITALVSCLFAVSHALLSKAFGSKGITGSGYVLMMKATFESSKIRKCCGS